MTSQVISSETGKPAATRRLPLFDRRFLALPQVLIIGVFLYGFVSITTASLFIDGDLSFRLYAEILSEPTYQKVLWRTVVTSVVTTAICVILGYPVAYLLARSRNGDLLLLLLISPWLVSVVVRTFGWMLLLGNRGVVNSSLRWIGLIDTPLRLMFNMTGVVIGLVHVLIPLMVICTLSVFVQIDNRLEEASRSLGAGPVETFWRVTWPLSLPGVYLGSILTVLTCMGAIVTPLLLGGFRETMLGTQIYQEIFLLYNFPRAAAFAIVLLITSFILVLPILAHDRHLKRARGM